VRGDGAPGIDRGRTMQDFMVRSSDARTVQIRALLLVLGKSQAALAGEGTARNP